MSIVAKALMRVINRGKDLEECREKVDKLYALGSLTESEHDQLIELIDEKQGKN